MTKIPEVPKKRNTKSKTGMRRSHALKKLRKVVNSRSPVKALSRRELAKQQSIVKNPPQKDAPAPQTATAEPIASKSKKS